MFQRWSTPSLIISVLVLAALIAAIIVLMTPLPAQSAEPIPCWQAKALLAYAGSEAEAEKIARRKGYTQAQIAEVRRRCGI